MAHDLFLSYARDDLERVVPIVRVLKRHGWTVWWDQKLLAGKRFTEAIQRELECAKAIIAIWSEDSVASSWVQSEAMVGMRREVLVPLRIDDVEPPPPFGVLHSIDHFASGEPTGATLVRLVKSLEPLAGKPIRRPAPVPVQPARPAPPTDDDGAATRREHRQGRWSRAWPNAALVGAGVVVVLSFGWFLKTAWAREPPPTVVPGVHQPAKPDLVTDPATGCRLPRGWEVVDGTRGKGDYARQVREPRSGIVFQLIPDGEFLMGSPANEPGRGDNETQHKVTLTRPFYLGVTEVTTAQALRGLGGSGGTDRPVATFTWKDAREFCKRIGCDLPTEAQWEYAARAGTTTRWWWGDAPEAGEGRANVFDDTAAEPLRGQFNFRDGYKGLAEAGRFAPNAFGLKDMIGNVWEWCLDDYGGDYGPDARGDPQVEVAGREHVLRGGSFHVPLRQTRIACRLVSDGSVIETEGSPELHQTGFRVAFTLE